MYKIKLEIEIESNLEVTANNFVIAVKNHIENKFRAKVTDSEVSPLYEGSY